MPAPSFIARLVAFPVAFCRRLLPDVRRNFSNELFFFDVFCVMRLARNLLQIACRACRADPANQQNNEEAIMATITHTAKTAHATANNGTRAGLPRDVAASLLRMCVGTTQQDSGCVSVPSAPMPSGRELYIGAGFHG